MASCLSLARDGPALSTFRACVGRLGFRELGTMVAIQIIIGAPCGEVNVISLSPPAPAAWGRGRCWGLRVGGLGSGSAAGIFERLLRERSSWWANILPIPSGNFYLRRRTTAFLQFRTFSALPHRVGQSASRFLRANRKSAQCSRTINPDLRD